MEHWLSDSSLQQMVRILQHHEQSYHRIQRFIETAGQAAHLRDLPA